ncbi:MAG: succinylglutamate-semialdehyde dehydrogenase, partial [Planctomycetota bacterium]
MSQSAMTGPEMTTLGPASGEVAWCGPTATGAEVAQAVERSQLAFTAWRGRPAHDRISVAERFAELATQHQSRLAESISLETGKPLWEAASEAKLIPAKVQLAIEAYFNRCQETATQLPQGLGQVRYQPIGVMAVLGPFNFPAHLPNGHLVPALIAGNTAVFKPSEWTPGTGSLLAQLWRDAGLPENALQVVQGGRDVGVSLVESPVDGVLFTGSYSGGCAIHRALAGRPEVLLALEMGGNNPLVVDGTGDIEAAAYLTVVSAFTTAGQRCTCARRLVLPDGDYVQSLLAKVTEIAQSLVIGKPEQSPEPFMGPLISPQAAERVLTFQQELIDRSAVPLLRCESLESGTGFLSAGLLDVTDVRKRDDHEVFGPLLQVIRVSDFDAAIAEANRTRYGLAASLLSSDVQRFERFRTRVRAGVVNWNQPTVGASGRLPFGGLGASGNHRPSGFFAADYCADATAVLETQLLAL